MLSVPWYKRGLGLVRTMNVWLQPKGLDAPEKDGIRGVGYQAADLR